MVDLSNYIRNIPDFPKKGILFRDITTLLQNGKVFAETIDLFEEKYEDHHLAKIAGVESRGFIFGSVLANRLGIGFVPVRKPSKLPFKTVRQEYQLEYGKDALEMHIDAITKGERVLVVDDLLATGGTAAATCRLVEQLGGTIAGTAFLIELTFLNGKEKLEPYEVFSLIKYDSES